jgi:hypothetical protein
MTGALGLVFYFCFAVSLNLALAHYREASGSLIEEAGKEVMSRVLNTPLALRDLKSWLFFAVGAAFSAAALVDGLYFGDPYPGYDKVEDRLEGAHGAYIERKGELIQHLDEIKTEASEIFQEANRDLSVRRSEHDAILESRSRLLKMFDDHQSQLERAANALLGVYREANIAARSTKQPKRFTQAYKLDRYSADQEITTSSARDDLRKSIAESQAILLAHVEEIQQEFELAVAGYQQIDDWNFEEQTVYPKEAKAA